MPEQIIKWLGVIIIALLAVYVIIRILDRL